MQKAETDGSFWAFALINGRLAQFYFEIIKGKFYMGMGHCYVKRSECKTKEEQKWIESDIKKYRFTYELIATSPHPIFIKSATIRASKSRHLPLIVALFMKIGWGEVAMSSHKGCH